MIRKELEPEVLLDAGGEPVGPGQHHRDVGAIGLLLGDDSRSQLRRGRLRKLEVRDPFRVVLDIVLDRRLGQLGLPGHVDHRQRDRLRGRLGGSGRRLRGNLASGKDPANRGCAEPEREAAPNGRASVDPTRANIGEKLIHRLAACLGHVFLLWLDDRARIACDEPSRITMMSTVASPNRRVHPDQ